MGRGGGFSSRRLVANREMSSDAVRSKIMSQRNGQPRSKGFSVCAARMSTAVSHGVLCFPCCVCCARLCQVVPTTQEYIVVTRYQSPCQSCDLCAARNPDRVTICDIRCLLSCFRR